jgi:hypothetical protein
LLQNGIQNTKNNSDALLQAIKGVSSESWNYQITQLTNDYGSDNLKKFGEVGIVIRVSDKIERLKQLLSNKVVSKVTTEKVSDTYLDIAGYAVQAIILIRQCDNWQKGLETVINSIEATIIPYDTIPTINTLDRISKQFQKIEKSINKRFIIWGILTKNTKVKLTVEDDFQIMDWETIACLALLGYKETLND